MGGNRAVIFANGALDDPAAAAALLRADDWLIAADGGLRHLRAIDHAPHVLIGDLDSVSAEEVAWAEAQGTRVLRYPPEKDDTDLELALGEVCETLDQCDTLLADLRSLGGNSAVDPGLQPFVGEAAATQRRPDAGQVFRQTERLGYIIVAARLQTPDLIPLFPQTAED